VTGSLRSTPPLLLGAYDANRCARAIHNRWDATLPEPEWEPDPASALLRDRGIAFEQSVRERLLHAWGDHVAEIADDLGTEGRIAATVGAMRAGIQVILGGQLPHDERGRRTGRPDLLLRMDGDGQGNRGASIYVPGDIKSHKTLQSRTTREVTISVLGSPTELRQVPGYGPILGTRLSDFLQLAHYSRMLDAVGFGPRSDERMGFIIGSDGLTDLDPSGLCLLWHDLNKPLFETYSRSRGSAKRSALERYDHEHDFRVKVALVAQDRVGESSDPAPLVEPIGQDECLTCKWQVTCEQTVSEDDASWAITSGRLAMREWLVLKAMGISSTVDLAALDPEDADFQRQFLAEVSDARRALKRLKAACVRAEMIVNSEQLRRLTPGPLDVPAADIEVDFDAEWDPDNRVYLWGLRIRQGQDDSSAVYEPIVDWSADFGAPLQAELAERCVSRLEELVAKAESQHKSIKIFHYNHVEVSQLREILGEARISRLKPHFFDLYGIVKEHFMGVYGLSIKHVAPVFGFEWRDDDAGGANSQVWIVEARRSQGLDKSQLEQRLLDYNEDDVEATARLRDGLRRAEVGTGLPSAS
jgi:predicted RecB family nuclease